MGYFKDLRPGGMYQTDLYEYLDDINDAWAALLAKIDTDTGDTTWATSRACTLDTTKISALGIRSQGDIIDFLNEFVGDFNGLCADLDGDNGVASTDYTAKCAIMDVFDSATQGHIKQNGMNESDLLWILDECFSHLHFLTRKLDSDATLTDTNYRSTTLAILANKVNDRWCRMESSTSWSSKSSSSSST
jgi:hypothetical protein